MADFNPKTATLREVAELYAKKAKRDKNFVSSAIQYFKGIADDPGSALLLFQKDEEGRTLLSKTFTTLPEDAPIKASMQNLRQVGLLLKENIGPDTPEYKLLPDEKPDTDLNKRIFGRAEPPKSQSQVAINTNPKKQAQLFAGVSKFLDNPETRPAALAIIFNLNTGLRPNAVLGLTLDQYYPDTGAVYVESDARGAKGRAVNIPLNPVADSILQELLLNKKRGDPFFTKPKGGKVTTTDVNEILRSVKVPDIMFDQATNTFYDSLHPVAGPGKTGSPLLRNVHSSVALSLDIPQERTAYLQGRSLKAASRGSTGELASYQAAFPGEVSDVDREFASKISSFYSNDFDVSSKIIPPEERITTQTKGYENYFDTPVAEGASADSLVDATSKQPSPELQEQLSKNNLNLADIIANFGKKTGKLALGALGLETARQVIQEPVAFARDVAIEGAMLAAKAPLSVAGAVPMIVQPRPDVMKDDTMPENLQEASMRQIAQEDAGFVNIDREPEANSVNQNQGFLSN